MKVSIIIPVYNVSDYVERCLQSVMAQTYTDIECIIVDDCTPDDSIEKCERMIAAYDGPIAFKVLQHEKNRGLSAARNTGLNHASGDFIYFADSDDYISPDLLKRCIDTIEGYDLVAFNYYKVEASGMDPTHFHEGILILDQEDKKVHYLESLFFNYSYLGWNVWMRLFRRDIIEKHELRFEDNNIIYAEDIYFCFLYELHCKSIVCIPDVLYFYTLRADSIMGKQERNHLTNLNRLNELSKALYKYLVSQEEYTLMKKRFPLVHMNIIHHGFDHIQERIDHLDIFQRRKVIMENITDLDYFYNRATGIINNKRELIKTYGLSDSYKIIRNWRYYLTGNKFLYQTTIVFLFPCKVYKLLTQNIKRISYSVKKS